MEWFGGSISEAVALAKRTKKLFLVYIEGSDDMSKNMTVTYDNPAVARKLSSEKVVALKLVANSVPYVQFCAIYPVLVIPSSYFIGANGAPIEIVTGNLTSTEFITKIDQVFQSCEINQTTNSESSSAAVASSSAAIASTSISEPSPSTSALDNPTNSIGASASQVATEPESKDSLQERLDRAKNLIEAQRQSKSMEEQELEKRREIERRNVGKAVQQAQQTKQENELKEWARSRAKEKEEERLAREKVKAMIAQDRAERAAKYQLTKEAEQAEKERLAQVREAQANAARISAMNSNEARLQFRLPDGSSRNHTFSADSTLEQARTFVREQVQPPFSHFTLCTTFPRRHFTESNYSETLRDLQLAPSAVLLILPAQAVTSVNQGVGFLSNLFWTLMSPLTTIWRFITAFFTGTPSRPEPSPAPEAPPNTQSTTSKTNQPGSSDSTSQSVRRREPTIYRRDGNIFRLNNQSDDEENSTYNGNSTQQM
ncbi:UBX domain-containing protein 4-like isoform X1 [Uloborus diversus]|uniref:UBX domain-containing protein 4-like isoform X1 n=1 Tax=Uloborus diversus TaxID=327109 RepID=UPI00240A4A02|nr:UBX domain-containing protein 4-like isoform X1 [Uloborus diversus]XP_054724412.1 UBX domain-containing protein 4-like isoform X1 [Uloborus diversus]